MFIPAIFSIFGTQMEYRLAHKIDKMDLEDLEKIIDQALEDMNHRSIPEFEGYSSYEMNQILRFPFEKDSPIQLQKLSEAEYKMIPILNQLKYLIELIDRNGDIKLTEKGFLPTKIVSDLYSQGFLKDELIEKGISKLYKETDSITINLTRILTELAGLTKKRKGRLSLTKSAEKILGNNEELLRHLFSAFANKFNWAYYDGYGDNNIGQLGCGFSLILLSKYGQEKRLDSFYAERYFNAFPQLLESVKPNFSTVEIFSTKCYSLRTFNRFLEYFGMINTEEKKNGFDFIRHISTTHIYDRLINCTPPHRPA